MSKWKCDICGTEFDNFQAQGFDNKIYCPLCFYKHEFNILNKGIDELITEYQTILNSLNKYQTQRFNHTQQIKIDLIKEFIEKLKKLKGE